MDNRLGDLITLRFGGDSRYNIIDMDGTDIIVLETNMNYEERVGVNRITSNISSDIRHITHICECLVTI